MQRLHTILLFPSLLALASCTNRSPLIAPVPKQATPATYAALESKFNLKPSPTQPIASPSATATPSAWSIVRSLGTLPASRLFFETKDRILSISIDCSVPSTSCFSEPTSISPEAGDRGGMEVSPDGSLVAIERVDAYGDMGLQASIRLISADERRIWVVGQVGTRAPAWSPDGERLAYIDYFGSGGQSSRICFSTVLQPYRCLPYSASSHGISSLTWSPDGQHLAYCESPHTADSCDLFVVDHDTHLRTFISHSARYPEWSPNGDLLLFAYIPNDHPVLMVASVQACIDQEENCTMELEPQAPGFSYDFSPDSAYAAYMTEGRLGVIEAACVLDPPTCTELPVSLSSPEYRVLDFSWSPGSDHLAYAASNDSEAGIFIVDIHGSGTVVVQHIDTDYFPRLDWRPP